MEVYFLGEAPYEDTWALQERLRERVQAGEPEALLLCEHAPTLTLGRSAKTGDVLADLKTLQSRGVACVRTSRGGQVTYHGPGQLVAYPIVRLRHGVVAHVEWLAGAVVDLAQALGVAAEYRREDVGVWIGARKLAAIGVHVSRRVAIHGLALNVTRQATAPFAAGWFIPCGKVGGQAISIEEALADEPPDAPLKPRELAEPLAAALCRRADLPPPRVETASVALLSSKLFVK